MPTAGIAWWSFKPPHPTIGDAYVDISTYYSYIWTGTEWVEFSKGSYAESKDYRPTNGQLENHPSLKAAWEEYLVIHKLLGL